MMEMEREPFDYDRVVVLDNPNSKNRHVGINGLLDLHEASDIPEKSRITISTTPNTEETAALLGEVLQSTDLLYVIGGDGTVNSTLKPALNSGSLIIPTKSGNACDLARSTSGRRSPAKLIHDYRHGMDITMISARPLLMTVIGDHTKGHQQTHQEILDKLAINYAGIGYTALSSVALNSPWKNVTLQNTVNKRLPQFIAKPSRLAREACVLAKAGNKCEAFNMKTPSLHLASTEECLVAMDDMQNQNNYKNPTTTKQSVDLSFVRSARMAKIGRMRVSHSDSFFLTHSIESMGVFNMIKQLGLMATGRMPSTRNSQISADIETNYEDGESKLYGHVDGEPFELPDKFSLSIGFSTGSIKLLCR